MQEGTYFVYLMPMGRMSIAADEQGRLVRAAFGQVELPYRKLSTATTNRAADQLLEYFAGKRTSFDVPLNAHGSTFQCAVWQAISQIPYGQTRTYAQIAEAVGNPQGFRAVGAAANANPLPIFVPCHRVVGANGKLVGYAGGLKIKEFLLNLEGALER